MRITRVIVKNYRVHELVEVEFHETTSLLGGNNEAGKSTLMEAIHRAFFFPAKGETATHKAMWREGCRDKPEVTVCFEHLGREYELWKCFGGTRAGVQLRESGRPAVEGDAAEELLKELTGAGMAGKTNKEELIRKPWSHLWVWQGSAGDTPTEFMEGAMDQLVALTSKGAGTVVMSPIDSAIAAKFGALYQEGHTSVGKTKVGSDLGRAQVLQTDCESTVAELRAQVRKLEGAAAQHVSAAQVLANAEPKKMQVRADLESVAEQIIAATRIKESCERARETHRQLVTDAARMRLQAVHLKSWNASISEITGRLEREDNSSRLEAHVESSQAEKASEKLALEEARARKKPLADQQAKIEARVSLLRAEKALQAAEKNAARVTGIREELKSVEAELADLPEVKSSMISFLREQEQLITTLQTKLQALQSTIQIVGGDASVTLNGRLLIAGVPVALTAENLLESADGLSAKLTVPGVADADKVRTELDEKRAGLTARLNSYVIRSQVVETVQQLADALQQREGLERRQQEFLKRLRAEQADEVAEALRAAERDHIQARNKDSKLEPFEGWSDPADLAAAEAEAERLAQLYTQQGTAIELAEAKYLMAENLAEEALKRQAAFAKTRRADEDELQTARALRHNLLAEHNDSEQEFTSALTASERSEGIAERELNERVRELEATQLDVLEGRKRRYLDAQQNIDNEISASKRDLHQAEGQLKADGDADPFTDLREAEALLARAEVDCRRHALEAQSNRLLHDLFKAELDTANASITEPLAREVQVYLRRLFGPRTVVELTYADGKFGEFQLRRPDMSDYPEAFGSLSGGAREQVAAAVRLATAQLLAADHGGQLPVIFDDAFVNTDPERIPGVIDMLYHAAEQGLQVIVSTCDPARYQNIGKVKWTVRRGEGARSG